MNCCPHLGFNGECREAFEFYRDAFGGTIEMMMTWGESPMADSAPPALGDYVLHASMSAGELRLTGADTPPDKYEKPHGFAVLVGTNSVAEAERIFNVLAAGGTVQMPLGETFWAVRFGMVIDRFGIPWMMNCGGDEPGVKN